MHMAKCVIMYQNSFIGCEESFKEQPTVINRYFLDHGMMSKPVRRNDCITLFLLFYNLLILLDMEF